MEPSTAATGGVGLPLGEGGGSGGGQESPDTKKRKVEFMIGDVDLVAAAAAAAPAAADVAAVAPDAPPSPRQFRIPEGTKGKVVNFLDREERSRIESDLRGGDTISKIVEEGTTWHFRQERCEQIKALLVATENVDPRSGLHYYNIDGNHGIDTDTEQDPILISRHHSRGVVEAIEEVWKSSGEYRSSLSYIVGPPGVGKTRTLQLLLRNVLLSTTKAASVRYYNQKDDYALWILLVGDKLSVFRALTGRPSGDLLMENMGGSMFERSLVLLDPREATKGGAEFVSPRNVHMVVACSANENHYPADPSKVKNSHIFYLGLWLRNELRRAHELRLFALETGDFINAGVIDRRANEVGEAPRYIFQKTSYQRRVRLIVKRAKLLTPEIVKSAITDGDVSENGTVAGCFFAHINGTRNGNAYKVPTIRYLSRFSMATMYEVHRATMLSAMEQGDTDGADIFELLAGFDVHSGGEFVVREMNYTDDKSSKGKSERSVVERSGHSRTKFLLPDTPTEITRTVCVEPLLRNGTPQFTSEATLIGLSKCYPGIDYVGNERDVYQATVGDDHDRKGWVELLADAGILISATSPLVVARDAEVLNFYWLVPSWKESKWSNAAKTLRQKDCKRLTPQDIGVVNKALLKYVVQRVLLIPAQKAFVLSAKAQVSGDVVS